MPADRIAHNLTNHPPVDGNDGDVVAMYLSIRLDAMDLGYTIERLCPESREKSLALTNLEQTVMWAVAAIARNQQDALKLYNEEAA
jgi:hypothetical protein